MKSSVSRIALALVCACALIFGSCTGGTLGKGTDSNGSDNANASADGYVHLSGDIKAATTLDASKAYVVDSWFSVDAALTIPAGTVIKFKADTYMATSGSGTITAVGSAEKPIVFTAYAGTTPGYWGGIQATTKGNGFSYCSFEYAKTGLDMGADPAVIDHCTFANSSVLGLDATEAPAAAKIANCRFYGNNKPVEIGGAVSFDNSNLFASVDGKTANTQNAIFMDGSDVKTTVSWANIQVPYVVEDWFNVDASLTIAAGAVVKFKPDMYIATSESGSISAVGTGAAPIIFTAYSDDNVGGNTDAASTSPSAGYWQGLKTDTPGNKLAYCNIMYAKTGLDLGANALALDRCVFAYSSVLGLDATDAPAATKITNCRFYGNNKPVAIGGTVSFDDTNSFTSVDGSVKNTYNGIFKNGSNIDADVEWANVQVPYVVENWFTINASLKLASNVVVKFYPETHLDLADTGTLGGFADAVFTAYSDDSLGDDTNGDGSVTTPTAAYWNGIQKADYSYMSGANIRYSAH